MPDKGHKMTDDMIKQLEDKLHELYTKADSDLQKKAASRLKTYNEMVKVKEKTLDKDAFKEWKKNQAYILSNQKSLVDTIADDLVKTDQIALDIINDHTPKAYALNYNYGTYQVEDAGKINTSFALYNHDTVELLALYDDSSLLPEKKDLDIPKDLQWNKKHLSQAIAQGVLQGESIDKIAKRLSAAVGMDENGAIRNARTMMTAAQNGGRVDAYLRGKAMGIELQQKWRATEDSRTRKSHRAIDGEVVEVGEIFSNKCHFPGDPSGPGREVYNCRCTLLPLVNGIKDFENPMVTASEDSFEVVDGKDISGSWVRRPDLFDFEIEDVMNAQGFDGKPRIVSADEFDKLVKQANDGKGFIAQRNYSAPDQKILETYRQQLYEGKWYVDCSTGGAQYGQGMYCAADYTGTLTDGIKAEMKHYAELNKNKTFDDAFWNNITQKDIMSSVYMENVPLTQEQWDVYIKVNKNKLTVSQLSAKEQAIWDSMFPDTFSSISLAKEDAFETFEKTYKGFSYTETLTLDSSAKIINFDDLVDEKELANIFFYKDKLENPQKIINKFKTLTGVDVDDKTALKLSEDLMTKNYDELSKFLDKNDLPKNAVSGIYKEYMKKALDFVDKTADMDYGSRAVLLGYDAINAVGHGESGSYTVILNRTKLIIKATDDKYIKKGFEEWLEDQADPYITAKFGDKSLNKVYHQLLDEKGSKIGNYFYNHVLGDIGKPSQTWKDYINGTLDTANTKKIDDYLFKHFDLNANKLDDLDDHALFLNKWKDVDLWADEVPQDAFAHVVWKVDPEDTDDYWKKYVLGEIKDSKLDELLGYTAKTEVKEDISDIIKDAEADVKWTKGEPMSTADADNHKVNPLYNLDDKASKTNCQTCSFVYECRKQGYDVVALPTYDSDSFKDIYHLQVEISHDSSVGWINKTTGKAPKSLYSGSPDYDTIDKLVGNSGERYIFGVKFDGANGHSINLDRDSKGNLRIIDNQRGPKEKNVWTGQKEIEEYFKNLDKVNGIEELVRVDDCVPNAKYLNAIAQDAKKIKNVDPYKNLNHFSEQLPITEIAKKKGFDAEDYYNKWRLGLVEDKDLDAIMLVKTVDKVDDVTDAVKTVDKVSTIDLDALKDKKVKHIYDELKSEKTHNKFYNELKGIGDKDGIKQAEVWKKYLAGELNDEDTAKIEKYLVKKYAKGDTIESDIKDTTNDVLEAAKKKYNVDKLDDAVEKIVNDPDAFEELYQYASANLNFDAPAELAKKYLKGEVNIPELDKHLAAKIDNISNDKTLDTDEAMHKLAKQKFGDLLTWSDLEDKLWDDGLVDFAADLDILTNKIKDKPQYISFGHMGAKGPVVSKSEILKVYYDGKLNPSDQKEFDELFAKIVSKDTKTVNKVEDVVDKKSDNEVFDFLKKKYGYTNADSLTDQLWEQDDIWKIADKYAQKQEVSVWQYLNQYVNGKVENDELDKHLGMTKTTTKISDKDNKTFDTVKPFSIKDLSADYDSYNELMHKIDEMDEINHTNMYAKVGNMIKDLKQSYNVTFNGAYKKYINGEIKSDKLDDLLAKVFSGKYGGVTENKTFDADLVKSKAVSSFINEWKKEGNTALASQWWKTIGDIGKNYGLEKKQSKVWELYKTGKLTDDENKKIEDFLTKHYFNKSDDTVKDITKPDPKLKAAEEKLEKAKKELKDNIDMTQTWSSIWKDDVTLADYEVKKSTIKAKKIYYNDELDKLHFDPSYKSWMAEEDKQSLIWKYERLLDDLEEYEEKGEEYLKYKKAIDKAQKEVNKLNPIQSSFLPEDYSPEAKKATKFFTSPEEADKLHREYLDQIWNDLTDREKYSIWEYTNNSHPINKSLSGYHDHWDRNYFLGYDKTDWGHEDSWRYLPRRGDFTDVKKYGKNGTNNVDYHKVVINTTTALEKSTLPQNTYLVRGSGNDGFAGLIEGKGFMSYDDALAILESGDINQIKAAFEGQVVKNHAFTSTGIAKGTGFSGEVKYEIYAPKGTKAMYVEPQSHYGDTTGDSDTMYKVGESYKRVGGEAEILIQRGTEYRITEIEKSPNGLTVKMEVVEQPNYFKFGDEDTFNNGATRHKK